MNNEKSERQEYIINYAKLQPTTEAIDRLHELLEPFNPAYLRHVPYATVAVTAERERDLLETLEGINGITYRRTETRRALNDKKSIDDAFEE